jgi:hypothetical protein
MKRRPKKPIDEEMRGRFKTGAKPWVGAKGNYKLLDRFALDFADLVESDEPLCPRVRKYIADEVRHFNESPFYSMRRQFAAALADAQIPLASALRRRLQDCGLTATEAEQDVARELGISVDVLRKRAQRYRARHPRRGPNSLFTFLMTAVYGRRRQ